VLKERKARKVNWSADLKTQISKLKSLAESCSRQLRAWAESLQNSEIKGQRHLNDRVRRDMEDRARFASFEKELLRRLPAWHPKRKEAEEKGLI
jgi:hypothetical protein